MAKPPKTSPATDAVLEARKKYPELLQSVASHFGPVPYMKERIDPRARDKNLLMMDETQMADLARTDPVAAEQAAQRIHELQQKAPPLPPGQGEAE